MPRYARSEGGAHRDGSSVKTAGVLLGLGLGGFIDGIVLHQILQWHHMVSEVDGLTPDTIEDLRTNVVADGLFHAITWMMVVIGVLVLVSPASTRPPVRSVRGLVGWMAIGWGVFNLVEWVVNHHLLRIHRVRPAAEDPLAYDLGFLLLGALLVVGGLVLVRADSTRIPGDEEALPK